MLERLVHKADFERLLSVRAKTRSAHFAVHYVHGSPCLPKRPVEAAALDKLSTHQAQQSDRLVDNSAGLESCVVNAVNVSPMLDIDGQSQSQPSAVCWLGCVVPKRLAKRAVTRNMIKRQMRSAFDRHAATLPAGLWLVRLHQSFPVKHFVSAKSIALATAARVELDALLERTA